jgi:hypothetical protein
MTEKFNEDYYMNGISKGISLYENYTWRPEISMPIARLLKKIYPGKSILDFGCGKGYIVKALKRLDVEAYGYELSGYCLQCINEDIEIADEVYGSMAVLNGENAGVVFAKDVFEHIEIAELVTRLKQLKKTSKQMFAIVPLGDDGKYRCEDHHKDTTHIIAEDEGWWMQQFCQCDWRIDDFYYEFGGMKQKWVDIHPKGHGFFFLSRK